MNRDHKPLRLFHGPISRVWYGVTLNKDGQTIRDRYPLPEMDEYLNQERRKAWDEGFQQGCSYNPTSKKNPYAKEKDHERA